MKYCPQCRHDLIGNEKFCPDCGEDLQQYAVASGRGKDDNNNSISIKETKSDVIGVGVSGPGNIIAKTVGGNMLILNLSGSISKESMEQLKLIVTASSQLESKISQRESTTEDINLKSKETSAAKQQITTVLHEVERIEKIEGTQIQEIKVGDLQISHTELILKEYNFKGNEYYYKKEYSQAIEWYDRALEIDPNYGTAMYNKGLSLSNLGKDEEAIVWYDRALKIDPNHFDAMSNKGLSLSNLGNDEEAIVWYDRALSLDPNNGDALNNKGLAFYNLNQPQQAIDCYDKALEIDPNYGTAMYNKGLSLSNLGKDEEAIVWYDRALKIDPNHFDAMSNKGLSLSNLGNDEEAIVWYDRALSLDPNNVVALKSKGADLKKLGRHTESKE